MHIFKLLDTDYKLILDYEVPKFETRPDLIIYKSNYYHIKETKSIKDNQVHIYVQCNSYSINQ